MERHCSALPGAVVVAACGVLIATRPRRAEHHQNIYCLRIDILLYYSGRLTRDTRIRKPPDIRLPGSQPGPKLVLFNQWMRSDLGVRQDTLGLAPALRSRGRFT